MHHICEKGVPYTGPGSTETFRRRGAKTSLPLGPKGSHCKEQQPTLVEELGNRLQSQPRWRERIRLLQLHQINLGASTVQLAHYLLFHYTLPCAWQDIASSQSGYWMTDQTEENFTFSKPVPFHGFRNLVSLL